MKVLKQLQASVLEHWQSRKMPSNTQLRLCYEISSIPLTCLIDIANVVAKRVSRLNTARAPAIIAVAPTFG
jgi:hypothetical protein